MEAALALQTVEIYDNRLTVTTNLPRDPGKVRIQGSPITATYATQLTLASLLSLTRVTASTGTVDTKTILFQAAAPQSMWNCTPFAHPVLTEQQALPCGTLAQCPTCASLFGGSRWPSGWVREHGVSDDGEKGRAGGRTSYLEVKPSGKE